VRGGKKEKRRSEKKPVFFDSRVGDKDVLFGSNFAEKDFFFENGSLVDACP